MATKRIDFSELPQFIRAYYKDNSNIGRINRSDSIHGYMWMISMKDGKMDIWDKPDKYRLRTTDPWRNEKL